VRSSPIHSSIAKRRPAVTAPRRASYSVPATRMTFLIQPSSGSCICRKLSCANLVGLPLVTPAAAQ
jgi:hypothetical protein